MLRHAGSCSPVAAHTANCILRSSCGDTADTNPIIYYNILQYTIIYYNILSYTRVYCHILEYTGFCKMCAIDCPCAEYVFWLDTLLWMSHRTCYALLCFFCSTGRASEWVQPLVALIPARHTRKSANKDKGCQSVHIRVMLGIMENKMETPISCWGLYRQNTHQHQRLQKISPHTDKIACFTDFIVFDLARVRPGKPSITKLRCRA